MLRERLLSGKLLAKNTILSILSVSLPLVVAVFATPKLVETLGEIEYGLLIIIWSMISYSTFLDLGLTKAIVKYVSESIGKNKPDEGIQFFIGAFLSCLSISIILGTILYNIPDSIFEKLFGQLSSDLILEVRLSLKILSVGIPFILINQIYIGFFQANQKFSYTSSVQLFNSSLNYILPIVIYFFTSSFSDVVFSLIVLKFLIWLFFGIIFLKNYFRLVSNSFDGIEKLKKLFLYGFWISISNLLSPLLDYIDRFIIASLIAFSAVAYYSTPLDVLLKISMISLSFTLVFFPAISNTEAFDKGKTVKILRNGYKFILIAIFPLISLIITFSGEVLEIWINEDFANNGALVMQIIGLGIIFKSMAYLQVSYLQGIGKPDKIAFCHIIESIIYFFLVYILIMKYQIVGAALAQLIRMILDYFLLSYFVKKYNQDLLVDFKNFSLIIVSIFIVLAVIIIIENIQLKILYLIFINLIYLFLVGLLYQKDQEFKEILNLVLRK